MQSKEALDYGPLAKTLSWECSASNKLGADTASTATLAMLA
jgi:hypothetical protein